MFFDIYSNLDGHPSAAIVLKQMPGSNASEVIAAGEGAPRGAQAGAVPCRDGLPVQLRRQPLPRRVDREVVHTLVEAFVLVALVVFVFLGDWRSTLIPTLAVPVSLVGTFFFMQVFGILAST